MLRRHVSAIDPPFPLPSRPQDLLDPSRLTDLAREVCSRSLLRRATGSVVCKLLERDVTRVGRSRAPYAPACRIDHIAQVRVLKRDTGETLPWPPEIVDPCHRLYARVHAGHGAVVDDVPARVGGISASGGRNATFGDRKDGDGVQPSLRCLSEDEIDGAEDQ